MRGYQHAASPINAVFNDNKIVLARELMLIYAVQAAFLRCAAQPIAVW